MNEQLNKETYNKLTNNDIEVLLREISLKNPQFTFSHFECFEKNGMKNNTAIFLHNDCEFVFVPGNEKVTLGWDAKISNLDKNFKNQIEESMVDFGVDIESFDVEQYLNENTSNIRTAKISPMLVERTVNEIGWRKVSIKDNELNKFKSEIEEFRKGTYHTIIHNDRLKLVKTDNQIIAYIYDKFGYDEFVRKVESEQGFSIPTEDEWEYLCGGGKTTLFPWGNSFDFEKMNLKYFAEQQNEPYTLKQPNHFGLSIAYDPYKYEVVKSQCMLKGGDGGCNICGGLGIFMGYLPVATYFRGYNGIDDELNYKSNIGGEYTSYRRIFKLNE